MIKYYEILLFSVIPFILTLHYLFLIADDDSKHQQNKFRKSIELIYKNIVHLNNYNDDGIKFHEQKVFYKKKEFNIGVHKEEHSFRYTTYELFINGEEVGTFHILGDCCNTRYYFEVKNHRLKWEVMAIFKAGAKKAKKELETWARETVTWDNSYFK